MWLASSATHIDATKPESKGPGQEVLSFPVTKSWSPTTWHELCWSNDLIKFVFVKPNHSVAISGLCTWAVMIGNCGRSSHPTHQGLSNAEGHQVTICIWTGTPHYCDRRYSNTFPQTQQDALTTPRPLTHLHLAGDTSILTFSPNCPHKVNYHPQNLFLTLK